MEVEVGAAQQPRPKTPALVLGGIVTAISVLVAAVALTSRQAAPPAVAEFAPQSVEQIKKSLDEQAAQVNPEQSNEPSPSAEPSPSGSGAPTAGPSASASPTTVEVPRVRQCVRSPPRQTEDPQSPPCVAYVDPKKSNGGATSPGVTKDQITVAMPIQFLENTIVPPQLIEFFNKRYEFYGRKLVLRPFTPSGCGDAGTPKPAEQRADAIAVHEELNAFASLAYCNAGGADSAYYNALAERKVVSVSDGNLITGTEPAYAKHQPYQWNVQAGVDSITANLAEFTCATLAGRAPRYAGSQQRNVSTRKFGLIYTRATDGSVPDLGPLRSGLK